MARCLSGTHDGGPGHGYGLVRPKVDGVAARARQAGVGLGRRGAVTPVICFGAGGVEFAPTARGMVITCHASAELHPAARVNAPTALVNLLASAVG